MMVEWPGRCSLCRQSIEEWSDAGLHSGHWVHKACFQEERLKLLQRGVEVPQLQSPIERKRQLEWPMLTFLLMFHFGLGGIVSGWLLMSQNRDETIAAALIVIGIVVPLIGIAGVVVNVMSRRRIELVRQALEVAGGWKPGR